MITQTYQVSSSKHSNICAISSPKTKHTFTFTPTPNSIPKFENKEEEKCPSLVKSVPFKSKPQKIESDSSEDEYAGLKAKPEDSDEVSAWETPKSRKRTSHCMDEDYDIIECVNQKFKRKISNINNDTLTEYKKKLSSILNGSSNFLRKEIKLKHLYDGKPQSQEDFENSLGLYDSVIKASKDSFIHIKNSTE